MRVNRCAVDAAYRAAALVAGSPLEGACALLWDAERAQSLADRLEGPL